MHIKQLFIFTLLSITLGFSTLFASEVIQPSNGKWQASIDSNNVKGCPSMVTSMLPKQDFPTKSKDIIFSTPFHPSAVFDEGKDLRWEKTGDNQWRAIIAQAKGGFNMNMTWELVVKSKETMSIQSLVSMNFPAEMAAMLGSSGACKIETMGDFKLIK